MKLLTLFRKKPQAPIKDSLIFAFKDLDGRSYYKFQDETKLPIERMAMVQKFMIEMTRGMSSKELDNLLGIAEKHIHSGLKDPRNASKVAGVIHEIRLRETMISHVDLCYSYLAACYIREDEEPTIYNQQAQIEKIEAFKKGANKIDSFFFALPEYKELCKLLNISTGNWKDVTLYSTELNQRTQKVIELLK